MNPVQNSMILFLFLFTYMAQARFIPDESTTTTTTTTTISDRSTPTSDNFANSPAFLNNEPAQYCGETLYYVVEYYCVYVKGTSVYVPEDGDDDSVNVIGDGKKRRNLESSDESQVEGGGIVDECCYRACKPSELAKYCN